jgi:chloride channel protein, CIC family
METDVFVLDEHVPFHDMLARADGVAFRHVVVTRAQEIHGVLRINTGLRRAVSGSAPDIPLGTLAQRNFIIVEASDVAFGVITRLWKQHAAMAVVVGKQDGREAVRVLGVIAKEHIADAVASSIRIFPGQAESRLLWGDVRSLYRSRKPTKKEKSGEGKGGSNESDT